MTETPSYMMFEQPKPSGWKCELFGLGTNMVMHPTDGNVPNWFWRWTQFLILGNRWKRVEPTKTTTN